MSTLPSRYGIQHNNKRGIKNVNWRKCWTLVKVNQCETTHFKHVERMNGLEGGQHIGNICVLLQCVQIFCTCAHVLESTPFGEAFVKITSLELMKSKPLTYSYHPNSVEVFGLFQSLQKEFQVLTLGGSLQGLGSLKGPRGTGGAHPACPEK